MSEEPGACVSRDVEQLRVIYRYAQVGKCVSSVTHDINNLLGAISAYAELISLDETASEESRRMLREIIAGVGRSSALVNTLTSVARRERRDPAVISAAQLVDHVLDLRRYDIKTARIRLATNYAPGMPSIVCYRAQLELALIYLITNAIEALEAAARRDLHVSVRQSGRDAEIAIWNSGPPIETAIQERMFEPFFTTKGPGHPGLGLGLAREIVAEHGGQLEYQEERGFVITLPPDGIDAE